MTGGAAVMSRQLGAQMTAWDGYISGINVELVPGWRIVQTWRTTKFSTADPDSAVTVQLQSTANGTRLTLIHANVPEGHVHDEQGSWERFYFKPMLPLLHSARSFTFCILAAQSVAGSAIVQPARPPPHKKSAARRRSVKRHARQRASNRPPIRKRSRRS
jgi:hypothetical protein